MAFELAFPAGSGGGSPSNQWLPSRDPVIEGSDFIDDEGILLDVMADQATIYAEQIASPWTEYVYVFEALTATDKTNYNTFVAAALGAAFDLKDGVMSSYVKVKFSEQGFRREWHRGFYGGLYSFTLTLRTQP